jgi:hypothetical protein
MDHVMSGCWWLISSSGPSVGDPSAEPYADVFEALCGAVVVVPAEGFGFLA